MSDHDLSDAYLRLRALIPGAYDTPDSPTPEQVWEVTEAALRRVLQERADTSIQHPVTRDTWVIDRRTGRTREVVPAAEARAREEGARILAEAADDFVAAQRLAPYPEVPNTDTHERIAAALVAARSEEREACARHVEALATEIRDKGPKTAEGLSSALAGAQIGALLDAAASLRTGPWDAPRVDLQYGRMQDALERIVSWSEAYPLDIFPKPDLGLARELLEAGGITLDAVSAHCMRHVIDGVGKIAREAVELPRPVPQEEDG